MYERSVKALLFSRTEQELFVTVQDRYSKMENAVVAIQTSDALKCLLQHCLVQANLMNEGKPVSGGTDSAHAGVGALRPSVQPCLSHSNSPSTAPSPGRGRCDQH